MLLYNKRIILIALKVSHTGTNLYVQKHGILGLFVKNKKYSAYLQKIIKVLFFNFTLKFSLFCLDRKSRTLNENIQKNILF